MTRPYSIRIFLPAGDPDGLRTIEKSNWSGSGIVIPRALISEARQRRELSRTGVYVLVGPPEETGLPRMYIGEGDPIRPRLRSKALFIESKSIRAEGAEGAETPDGFVVRAGSGAVKEEVPSCHGYLRELRAALIANGALKPAPHGYTLVQDYVFASPSTAAGVVQGRAANGPIDWKTKDGQTLKGIQEAQAEV